MLRIYNTLTRSLEIFEPIRGNRVYMYVCGPTTYDYSHLGHARTYIAYDIMARYLRFKGYSLFFLMNITDVDDKIIDRAREKNMEPIDLAREYEKYFLEDLESLNIRSINLFARASEYIYEIIDLIKKLIERGYAYETETGVYFDTTLYPDYGRLSRQKPEELAMHRIEPDPTKRHPQDFALWKKRTIEEFGWSSPWGYGRPGWHIEDTAIILTHFRDQCDIHGGAIELAFPHHEAEIAQAECATGIRPFAKYWCHTGLLTVSGEKMSKSLGNFITIREVIREYDAEVLRLFFSSAHYRSPIDFDWKHLEQSKSTIESLYSIIQELEFMDEKESLSSDESALFNKLGYFKNEFLDAMNDDFNTPKALTVLFKLASDARKLVMSKNTMNKNLRNELLRAFYEMGGILGILQRRRPRIVGETYMKLLDLILEVRELLRKERKYEIADNIRQRIYDLGFIIEDTANGPKIKYRVNK
ncbi:MAG: cysteine--tRNA ligase [Nitrososphaerota archaeon]